MSSMNEGSDEGAREDELDLGQEDEELPAHPNGPSSNDGDDGPVDTHPAGDADYMFSANAPSQDDNTLDEASTQHLPPVSKATDEASSNPDDTPSLHVSEANLLFLFLSIYYMHIDYPRVPCSHRQAAAP